MSNEYSAASPESKKALQQTLETAKYEHAKSIRNAPKLRRQMLIDMAQEMAETKKCAVTSAIRQIQNAEQSKNTHSRHRFIMKGAHPGHLKHMIIPIPSLTAETTWIQIGGKEELHEALIAQNEQHLTASNISPFAYGPIKEAIKVKEITGTASIASLLVKENLKQTYGHLSTSVSKILEELEEKTDNEGNPLSFN